MIKLTIWESQDLFIFNERLTVSKRDSNTIELKSEQNSRVVINAEPLKVEFYIGDYLVLSLNSKHLLKFEHLRVKEYVDFCCIISDSFIFRLFCENKSSFSALMLFMIMISTLANFRIAFYISINFSFWRFTVHPFS